MEIRDLRAKDVKTLAKMLGKLKASSVGDIMAALSGKGDPMAMGLTIFRVVAADLTDDIYAWLADLIGKPTAELDEMPVNTPAEIIKTLVERGDFKSFFGMASQQAKTAKSSPEVGMPSSAATDGQTAK